MSIYLISYYTPLFCVIVTILQISRLQFPRNFCSVFYNKTLTMTLTPQTIQLRFLDNIHMAVQNYYTDEA